MSLLLMAHLSIYLDMFVRINGFGYVEGGGLPLKTTNGEVQQRPKPISGCVVLRVLLFALVILVAVDLL